MARLLPLFRSGLGGRLGSGEQWFSWIHLHDAASAVLHCLEQKQVTGPVNLTAPQPVTNREFTAELGQALKRPAVLAVPGFAARLALGEFASVLLGGQRVLPAVLQQTGFVFRFPTVGQALSDVAGPVALSPQ